MELLCTSIRNAITQFGPEIIKTPQFINILEDFQAFKSIPSARPLLKMMIKKQDCEAICKIGRKKTFMGMSYYKPKDEVLREKIVALIKTISERERISRRLVAYVVQSIIYGLQWTEIIPDLNRDDFPEDNYSESVTYGPISDKQFVVFNIDPVKVAIVTIDQVEYDAKDGFMVTELAVGLHNYIVKAESYKVVNGSFLLEKENKKCIFVQLERLEEPIHVYVTAFDQFSSIKVNGKYGGIGEWNGFVEGKTIEIECSRYGYRTYRATQTLGSAKVQCIRIPRLVPLIGDLKINVQPYGSEIYIDDEKKGITPLLIRSVKIGSHKIRVVASKGKEFVCDAEIKEDLATEITHRIQE